MRLASGLALALASRLAHSRRPNGLPHRHACTLPTIDSSCHREVSTARAGGLVSASVAAGATAALMSEPNADAFDRGGGVTHAPVRQDCLGSKCLLRILVDVTMGHFSRLHTNRG
jgi:hypothetical protein